MIKMLDGIRSIDLANSESTDKDESDSNPTSLLNPTTGGS